RDLRSTDVVDDHGTCEFGTTTECISRSRKMKRHLTFVLGLSLAWLLAASPARAQALVINFDENGNGTIVSATGTSPLVSLGNQVDPSDPSNGLKPLIYDLTGSPGIGVLPVIGDVVLLEPGVSNTPSDLL